MVELTRQGRWDEARAIWERILPLEEVVYGSPVRDYRARTKVALKELGVIDQHVDAAAADANRRRRRRQPSGTALVAAGLC